MCVRNIQVWSLSAQRHTIFSQPGQRTLIRDTRRTALWHRNWDMSSGDSDLRSNCCSKSAEEFESGPSRASWVSYTWSCTTPGNLTSPSVPNIRNAPFCTLPPRACITNSVVACGGRLKQRLSPEVWRALRDRAQLWICTWRALKKVKRWCCCRRLNQYFCNSLLRQMSLVLRSRLSLAKHSTCLCCIQATAKLEQLCLSLEKCVGHEA